MILSSLYICIFLDITQAFIVILNEFNEIFANVLFKFLELFYKGYDWLFL